MSVFPSSPAGGQTLLTRADSAEALGAGANTIRLLADGATTGGAISANRTRMAAGMNGPPPHFHTGSAEIFFVLEGVLEALAGDTVLTLEKGDFLVVPKSMPHAFATPAGSSADLLVVFAPGMQDRGSYFRLVDRVARGRASAREILDSQELYDNHFLDSPLWREARGGGGNTLIT